MIVAYAIVHTVSSHSAAESNYVSTDNTGGFQLCVCVCVCEKEKTVKTTDNESLGSLRGEQGLDSILIKSVNKSTMFHFSAITVDKEGETCRLGNWWWWGRVMQEGHSEAASPLFLSLCLANLVVNERPNATT